MVLRGHLVMSPCLLLIGYNLEISMNSLELFPFHSGKVNSCYLGASLLFPNVAVFAGLSPSPPWALLESSPYESLAA